MPILLWDYMTHQWVNVFDFGDNSLKKWVQKIHMGTFTYSDAVPQHLHFGREFEWCGFPYCSMREDHAEQPNLKIFSSRWSRCLPTAYACRFSGTPSPFLASITHADTRTPLKFAVDYYCFWRQAFLSNENMNRTMRLCFDLNASETEKRTQARWRGALNVHFVVRCVEKYGSLNFCVFVLYYIK